MIAALKEKAIVQRGGLLEIRSASLPPPGTGAACASSTSEDHVPQASHLPCQR